MLQLQGICYRNDNRSCKKHNIDLKKSYLVGERESDILAEKNAQVSTVLVKTGYGSDWIDNRIKPDYVFENLKEFASFLFNL